MNFNSAAKIFLVGTLGRDAEFKQTQNTEMVRLSLAVTRGKKVGDKWENITDWFSCTGFGQVVCGIAEKHCKKGTQVIVTGRVEFYQKEGGGKGITIPIESLTPMKPIKTGGAPQGDGKSDWSARGGGNSGNSGNSAWTENKESNDAPADMSPPLNDPWDF
jgi:single stranded DNA-binding protein